MLSTHSILTGRQFYVELGYSLFLGLITLALFFPTVLFLQSYPMSGTGFLYTDPAAATLNFIPGIRLFKYELFNNFNLLWSNLRGFGVPYLAHEIQAAPLFPLTLLFAWVPEPWFWNVTFIFRILLTFSAAYLISFCLFKMNRLSSILFAVILLYNLFALRWMNHPWINGYFSGLWYLLFLALAGQTSSVHNKSIPSWVTTGIVISVYCMVTNGFPEASVLSAITTVLVLPFIYWQQHKNTGINIVPLVKCIVISHFLGFALSSPQLLSFISYLLQRPESDDLRTSFGMRQYPLEHLWDFVRYNISFTGEHISVFGKSAIGFSVLCLTLLGFLMRLRQCIVERNVYWIDIGILLSGLFYVIKNFPLWPAFNEFIGSLPLIREMYFHVYFFSMLQLLIAYYAALALQGLSNNISHKHMTWLALSAVLLSLYLLHEYFLYRYQVISLKLIVEKWVHFLIYSIFIGLLLLTLVKNRIAGNGLVIAILCLVFIELRVIYPGKFLELTTKKMNLYSHTDTSDLLVDQLKTHDIDRLNSRSNDQLGLHFHDGIASAEHGAPPFILERPKLLRTALYKTPMGGVRELGREIRPYSNHITATNLRTSDVYNGVDIATPDVSQLKLIDTVASHFDGTLNQQYKKNNPFTLSGKSEIVTFKGWGLIQNRDSHELVYTLVLTGKNKTYKVPLKFEYRKDVVQVFGNRQYRYSGWKGIVRGDIFTEPEYQMELQMVDPSNQTYSQTNLTTLKIKKPIKNAPTWLALAGIDKFYFEVQPDTLSRAYKSSTCVAVKDKFEATGHLKTGKNYQKGVVYLETKTIKQTEFCKSVHSPVEAIDIVKDKGSKVSLGKITGPGIVVLSDTYYPGWKAIDKLSGEELDILPANVSYRAVVLYDNREYELEFRYYPAWLNWSLLLITMSLLYILSRLMSFPRKKIIVSDNKIAQ